MIAGASAFKSACQDRERLRLCHQDDLFIERFVVRPARSLHVALNNLAIVEGERAFLELAYWPVSRDPLRVPAVRLAYPRAFLKALWAVDSRRLSSSGSLFTWRASSSRDHDGCSVHLCQVGSCSYCRQG